MCKLRQLSKAAEDLVRVICFCILFRLLVHPLTGTSFAAEFYAQRVHFRKQRVT